MMLTHEPTVGELDVFCRSIALDTENAASNDHMLAINIAMGYSTVYEQGVWQAPIDEIRSHL